MRVGVHVSVAGGLMRAAARAHALGCECVQIFGRNPRGWRARPLSEEEAAGFRELLRGHGIQPLGIHASYLVNLASPDPVLRDRSLRAVAEDIARAARLGGSFLVTHPGHHMGQGIGAGLRALAAGLRCLLAEMPQSISLLLENTAGRGSELGGDWEEFVEVLELLGGDERVGFCFDTCHAHAAGYSLHSTRAVARTMGNLRATLGLSRLRLLHLNDCRGPAGARRDVHEHIGQGSIGERGFRALLRRRELRGLCAILETPLQRAGDDRRNLARVRALLGEGGR